MPVAHHFPDQQRQTLSKHQRKQSATAAKAQASASAGVADRILHTAHANSFVGLGGSDGKATTATTYQRQQDDDNHTTRDSGSCVDVGNDVGCCGEFGGEGFGRVALGEGVQPGVLFVVLL